MSCSRAGPLYRAGDCRCMPGSKCKWILESVWQILAGSTHAFHTHPCKNYAGERKGRKPPLCRPWCSGDRSRSTPPASGFGSTCVYWSIFICLWFLEKERFIPVVSVAIEKKITLHVRWLLNIFSVFIIYHEKVSFRLLFGLNAKLKKVSLCHNGYTWHLHINTQTAPTRLKTGYNCI